MSKQLPGVGSLISESWHLFISSWNETIKITIWILYLGLAYFMISLLVKFVPMLSFLTVAMVLILALFSTWVAIRLIQVVLELLDGKKPVFGKEVDKSAINLILPLIWIGILQTAITLGGLVLLIIPGIYLIVALMFSQIMLISEGVHGSKALQMSRELIKGRWWAVLWRIFAGSFVISVIIGVLSSLIFIALGFIVGPEFLRAGKLGTPLDPLIDGTVTLFQSIIQAACISFFIIYQAKIFRLLQKTR